MQYRQANLSIGIKASFPKKRSEVLKTGFSLGALPGKI